MPRLPTLAVMAHRGVSVPTLLSVLQVSGWSVTVHPGDALISRVRSIAATQFLAEDSDVLVMTDDDFYFTADGLNALFERCLETSGIIAGVTPLRSGEFTAIVPLNHTLEEPWLDPSCPPMRIKWAGGLIAYHRSVFTRLAKTLPLCHENDSIPAFYPFFMPMTWNHPSGRVVYLSEDYSCHERAGELGIPIWVEPKCQVGHLGEVMIQGHNMHRIMELHQPEVHCDSVV